MYNNYFGGYYYVYEATSESTFGDIRLILDESYLSSSLIFTIIFGLLAMALVLTAAIFIKRARPLGIVAAVAQPVGMFAVWKCVISYSEIDFSSLYMTVTGSSQQDAINKLYERVGENFMEYVLPSLLTYFAWAFVVTAAAVVTVIYAIMLFKSKAKVFAVLAFVFVLVRWVFFSPIEITSIFTGSVSQDTQVVWDFVYRIAYIIPPVLIGILALFNLPKKAPVAVAAPAVEAAAENVATLEADIAPASDVAAENAAADEAPASQDSSDQA